jgi:hypothetical protein
MLKTVLMLAMAMLLCGCPKPIHEASAAPLVPANGSGHS